MIAVSAPGKLILMGEHGAVYGLPALTAALGLRVRAELHDAGGRGVELELPDLGIHEHAGWRQMRAHAELARERRRLFDDGAPFERDPDPASLVRVALGEALGELDVDTLPALRLRVRSELPVGAGFGSSAAVAVAVAAGVLAWRGVEPAEERVSRMALDVERFQHGRPSGIDHATVLRGGVQWAGRDTGGRLRLRPVAVAAERLRVFRVYDTGPPAESTGTVVAAVAARRGTDTAAFDAVLARMDDATQRFRAALEGSEGAGLAPAVRAFERCLEEIDVVPEPVRRVVRRLERAGGAAKVSGAGALSGATAGGLLACFPSSLPDRPVPDWQESDWTELDWTEPAGWRRIDCAMGAPGLRVEAA